MEQEWSKTLTAVVPAVVAVKLNVNCPFDTELPCATGGTGFVVDKTRGIILTNRHVMTNAPVVARGVLHNNEEIHLYPLYFDPIHDFAFFRYDPESVPETVLNEIPLAPEAAHVGMEIRVVGNDAGEQLSILGGTLARLDREAPMYPPPGYHDFNIFYIQAASGTSGGSSGSPVVDRRGRAVAVNAGGSDESMTGYFLPLDGAVRALGYLQRSKDQNGGLWQPVHIPRGTLQTTFVHDGFGEIRRLGLPAEIDSAVREAFGGKAGGMLYVDTVVPGGAGNSCLKTADVLVRVNGEYVIQFSVLEKILDDNVGEEIVVEINRRGRRREFYMTVQDLHSVTPDRFLEVGDTYIHPMSYHVAKCFNMRCGMVYVASPGYLLTRAKVDRYSIITKLANVNIDRVEDFLFVLLSLPPGSRVPLEYLTFRHPQQVKGTVITMDLQHWFGPPQYYSRNLVTGLWDKTVATVNHLSRIPNLPLHETILATDRLDSPKRRYLVELGVQLAGLARNSGALPVPDLMDASDPSEDDFGSLPLRNLMDSGSLPVPRAAGPSERHSGFLSGPYGAGPSDGDDSGPDFMDAASSEGEAARSDGLSDGRPSQAEDDPSDDGSGDEVPHVEEILQPSLVAVQSFTPSSILVDYTGMLMSQRKGVGVVVHHGPDFGLILVDKSTVPTFAVDISLQFAAVSTEIPGQVFLVHPVYYFSFVAYDPAALGPAGAAAVRAAELFPDPALVRSDIVYLVGLSSALNTVSLESSVTNASAPWDIPANSFFSGAPPFNMDAITVDNYLGNLCFALSGVLADRGGRVRALWAEFQHQIISSHERRDHNMTRGIPIYAVIPLLERILDGSEGLPLLVNGVHRKVPYVRLIGAEFSAVPLSHSRSLGLTDEMVAVLFNKDPVRKQVLCVTACFASFFAETALRSGDVVLAIEDEPITCYRDIDEVCYSLSTSTLRFTILRNHSKLTKFVATKWVDGFGTTHILNWAGFVIQPPPLFVLAQGYHPRNGEGVYATVFHDGSPAQSYLDSKNLHWIVEVNGMVTPNMNALTRIIQNLEHGEAVRVTTLDSSGRPRVGTFIQDVHYWPTWELFFDPIIARWTRNTIKSLQFPSSSATVDDGTAS